MHEVIDPSIPTTRATTEIPAAEDTEKDFGGVTSKAIGSTLDIEDGKIVAASTNLRKRVGCSNPTRFRFWRAQARHLCCWVKDLDCRTSGNPEGKKRREG